MAKCFRGLHGPLAPDEGNGVHALPDNDEDVNPTIAPLQGGWHSMDHAPGDM